MTQPKEGAPGLIATQIKSLAYSDKQGWFIDAKFLVGHETVLQAIATQDPSGSSEAFAQITKRVLENLNVGNATFEDLVECFCYHTNPKGIAEENKRLRTENEKLKQEIKSTQDMLARSGFYD